LKIDSIEEVDNLGLTADERAAMAEEAAETAAAAAPAGKDDDETAAKPDADGKPAADAAAAGDDKAAKPADADPAKADAGAAEPDKAAAGDKPDADPAETSARQAVPNWQAPADAKAKLEEIDAQRDKLAEQFDAGEITAKELFAQQRTLDRQSREIERAIERAEDAHDMSVSVWTQTTVPTFLDANTHYRDNQTLNGMLDAEVRRLQVEASKAGKDPLSPSILKAADEAIRASLGAFGVPAAKPAGDKPAGDKQAAADPKPGKPEIPPTLGQVPASEISGTDSKFASLDRLDPIDLEVAMAKMSDADREAFLARSH